MTNSKKIKQINMIIRKFETSRNEVITEINAISKKINNDQMALKKILNYKKDYTIINSKSEFGSSVAMIMNNENFLKRINNTIMQQENTIKMAEHNRSQYEVIIKKYEQKIKALNTLITKYHKKELIYKENEETILIDDIISNRVNRSKYE